MTQAGAAEFDVRLARTSKEVRAAQGLRYRVFVEELGGSGPLVDHHARLERDALDPFCDHLLLVDRATEDVVGVYRLMGPEHAAKAGRYYSASEYHLDALMAPGRRVLELGRSCLRAEYRGGMAMHHLWSALAAYVAKHAIDIIFGVASFRGTDVQALAAPLSLLHHRHLAPPDLRVTARAEGAHPMNLIAEADLDRKAAMLQVPALIKAYLRLGGYVGEGAFVDHDFNTTDVCLIMETARLSARQAKIYGHVST